MLKTVQGVAPLNAQVYNTCANKFKRLFRGCTPECNKIYKSMLIINTPSEMKEIRKSWAHKTVGLVPTMGALHDGHISLIEAAKPENDIVVVSIFVNPTQFGPNEDLEKYPRDFESDRSVCEDHGVDAIFYPKPEDIYTPDFATYVKVENLSEIYCGKFRPVHFRGVTTICNILFNLIRPDKAYFGAKDFQQSVIIERMIKDLHLGCEMVRCPIVREPDGLALSSRNKYLSPEERQRALIINKAIQHAKKMFSEGITDGNEMQQILERFFRKEPGIKMEYIALVDPETLEPETDLKPESRILIAAYAGSTRLIDNDSLK